MITKHKLALALILSLPALAAAADGSLINPDHYRGVASDRRAYRIGDPLSIIVLETAAAESRARTGTAKDWDFSGQAHRDNDVVHDIGIGFGGRADGTGQTTRQGRLRAQISVRVIEFEKDDLLRVRGDQNIVINGETQTITIEGLVRREDIGPDNTVLSPRLSDATISFTGDGVISESQERSWIYKLFDWMGFI